MPYIPATTTSAAFEAAMHSPEHLPPPKALFPSAVATPPTNGTDQTQNPPTTSEEESTQLIPPSVAKLNPYPSETSKLIHPPYDLAIEEIMELMLKKYNKCRFKKEDAVIAAAPVRI